MPRLNPFPVWRTASAVCIAVAVALASAASRSRAAGVGGLWAYETLARGGAQPAPVAGLFVFLEGRFVQQSVNVGEPYERQLAQAHAGTYRLDGARLRMFAEVGVVIDPAASRPVEWRDDSAHEVTVAEASDQLTLTFATGTVQRFRRIGPGRGELIRIDRGALALVDGRFILAAEAEGRAASGSGTYERQAESLELRVDRWVSVRGGRATYTRDRTIAATLTSSAFVVDGEAWPVRAARR